MAADGFCPKCGAIVYNGECTSCKYGKSKRAQKNKNQAKQQYLQKEVQATLRGTDTPQTARYSSTMAVGEAEKPKSISKAVIVVTIVLLIAAGACSAGFSLLIHQVEDNIYSWQELIPEKVPVYPEEPITEINPEYDFSWGDDLNFDDFDFDDFEYEVYIPSADDEFYEEFVNATSRDMSYEIAWNNSYISADDSEVYASYSVAYPIIIGSEKPFINDINSLIYAEAMSYEAVTIEDENFGYTDCYVTYMTEEILSVVFMYYNSQYEEYSYQISALNFDMTTGEMISLETMIPDGEYVPKFRETCAVQNGFSSTVQLDHMSDAEVMEAIENPETGVAFYTPVGLDIGFNYLDGWVTVTMK